MSRLIITGAGGFLGCNVVEQVLAEEGFAEVLAITRKTAQLKNRFRDNERLKIYESNSITTGEISLTQNDIVLNCAYPRAMRGVDVTSGFDYIESVFREAAKANIKGIINISSQSVYDPQRNHPAIETDVPILVDEYAIGKYCMEMLLRNICQDIPYTNIRLASLIGPGFDVRVPNKLAINALRTGVITVEDNRQRFGYLDVLDAAKGLSLLAASDPRKWKCIFNLGPEETYTLIQIAEVTKEEIYKEYGRTVCIKTTQGSSSMCSALNCELFENTIGKYREHTLQDSLNRIIRAISF